MIRRQEQGSYFLITQRDHALLAARLAEELGASRFTAVGRGSILHQAIAHHDGGWPARDDHPALNSSHQPMDFLETPRSLALPIWAASADAATAVDPYAGLLVSLHSLSLSISSQARAPLVKPHQVDQLHAQFRLNKFQHGEIERQERLRRQLGFPVDIPLTHGLAQIGDNQQDDRLRHHFHLLQAMDLISLCLCCNEIIAHETGPLQPTPGAEPIKLKIKRDWRGRLSIKPWPFARDQFELTIPYKAIPRRSYTDEPALQAAIVKSPTRLLPRLLAR